MALLSDSPAWDEVAFFPGAERILAAQASELPQPDQLCGPVSARWALHAILETPPGLPQLALAADSRIWPHDLASSRPAGTSMVDAGWEGLPRTDEVELSGTDAEGLVRGLQALCSEVIAVEQITGPDWSSLTGLLAEWAESAYPIAVIANVHTGPITSPESRFEVGHFVVLVGLLAGAGGASHVAVADSYAELGEPGCPPGCRLVTLTALVEALLAAPGRSLIVLRALR